ncbi:serine hydrolase, partial [Streptomyces sp. NPDC052610]
ALPPVPGRAAPPGRADDWAAAPFVPAGGVCADQPGLSAVAVGDGPDGWTATLTEDGHDLVLPLHGPDGWTAVDEPVPAAVSGGWTDAGTLTLDVVFTETPHHLLITCSLPDRAFTARWHTQPLHSGPLRNRRAPRPRSA